MMRKLLVLKPVGWPCEFKDLPPGLFIHIESGEVGLKLEYGTPELSGGFCDSGEFYHGTGMVQSVEAEWIETDWTG